MLAMLEALDVSEGQCVLEPGTGTGYNAALLCHRLGDANVNSIDIAPTLKAYSGDALYDFERRWRAITNPHA